MIAGFIFELTADGTIRHTNPAVTQLTGYSPEELLGVNWWRTFFPHEDEAAWQAYQDQIVDRDEGQLTMTFSSKNGSLVELEVHTALHRGADGSLERIMGFAADVGPYRPGQEVLDGEGAQSCAHLSQTSQKFYQTIFEHTFDVVLIANDEDRFIDVNPAACDLLGYCREELLAMKVPEVLPPADRRGYGPLKQNIIDKGHHGGEIQLLTRGGVLIDVEYHVNADILPGVHIAILHDITARKRTQRALQESEERYRQLVELSPDAIGIQSHGTIEFINSAGARMIGVDDPQELIGRNYMDFIRSGDFDQIRHRQEALDENKIAPLSEVQITRLDGSTIQIESTAIPFTHKGKSAVLFISRDITARKQAEETIRSFENRISTIVNRAPIVLFALDSQGNYTLSEGRGLESLGIAPGELVGRNALQLYGELSVSTSEGETITHRQLVNRVLAGESVFGVAMVNNAVFETHYLPQRDTAGEVVGLIGVGTEITDRVLAEKALQESEVRYRSLFEDSPISLWEDDFSGMKAYVDALREQGVGDLRAYFAAHPGAVLQCLSQARIVDVNRATLKLYQASTKDELLGGLYRVLDPGCYLDYAEGILSIAEGRTQFEIETVNRTLEGEPIDIILSWSVAPSSQSTFDHVLVSIFDITDRKRMRQAERDQRALAEALRDVSSALNSTLKYDEVLDRILENIARIADFETADILLVEDGVARIVRCRGYDEVSLRPDDLRPMTFEISALRSLNYMVATGLPLVIPDTGQFAGWVDIPELRFIKSFAGAPIRVRGEVIGFLNITSTRPGFYDQDYSPRLQALADQAAIALHNARLFEQVRQGRERLRALTQKVVTAQEEERRRLSRELHDDAGQSLTALKIGLQLVHDEMAPQAEDLRQQIKASIDLAETTMDQIRHLAQNLRPPALDAIGLIPTLRDFCDEWSQRTGLAINFEASDFPDLADEISVALYRYMQEALTNVARHARAEHVLVKLSSSGKGVSLSVIDDGAGFDLRETALFTTGSAGIGLLGMQERLDLLGGKLDIHTSSGSGTKLVARIPLEDDYLERRQTHDSRRRRR